MKSNIPNIKTSQIYPKFKIHIYVKTDCQNRQLRNFTNNKLSLFFFQLPTRPQHWDRQWELWEVHHHPLQQQGDTQPLSLLCAKYPSDQGAQNWSVNCYLESAMAHMAGSCNGRQSCSISEKAFTLNQDSCPGTERYLEAHYKCTPDKGELLNF